MTTAVIQMIRKTNFDLPLTCNLTVTLGALSGIMPLLRHYGYVQFSLTCCTVSMCMLTLMLCFKSHTYSIKFKY